MVEGGKRYRIRNVKGNTYLDLSAGDSYSVLGWENNGGENQQWEVNYNEDTEAFSLKNVGTGKYLDFEGEDPGNGVKIIALDAEVAQWDFPEDNNGNNKIFWKNSIFVVDLSKHGDSADGTVVTLWRSWEGENQSWVFEEV